MRVLLLPTGLLFLSLGFLSAACGEVASEPSGTGAGGAGGSDGGAGGGGGDECTSDADCVAGGTNFCAATDDGACGPIVRKCIIYPASCGEGTLHTACGCDGQSHADGPCPSATLAVQLDKRPGACPPAPGSFWCGEGACTTGTQYCLEGADTIACADLPAECVPTMPTCACLEAAGLTACGCVDEDGGGVRVNGCGL